MFSEESNHNKKLIDVGCGAGFWMDVYERYGFAKTSLTGVDLSPGNIERLKGRGIAGHCCDIVDLSVLPDKTFDFTVCNGVLMCASNPYKGFEELVRITKPGGKIYLNVYNAWHPYNYLLYKPTYPLRYIYYHWTQKIIDFLYPLSKVILQPLAYLSHGEFLDEQTAKTIFMDTLITPRLKFFTKRTVETYARKNGCVVREFFLNRFGLMLACHIVVSK